MFHSPIEAAADYADLFGRSCYFKFQGPAYPKLGAKVEKYRQQAKRGEEDTGYGAAVLDAIRALNKATQNRAASEPRTKCPCASGTWHSEAKDILAAVNAQNITRCWNANAAKQARSDEEIIAQYHAHMKKQRAIQELI